MTRRPLIALLIVLVLSVTTAVTLSAKETLRGGSGAEEIRGSQVLETSQDLPAPPTWVLEDWSWM